MFPCRALAVTLVAAALVAGAGPALAMTPKAVTPGWSPFTPPSDPALFADSLPYVLYSVACGDVRATGWSADVADDTGLNVRALLVTTSAVSEACASRPEALVVRQGDDTFTGRPLTYGVRSGLGSVVLEDDLAFVDWDFVPTPQAGQWVAISARGPAGEPLPMIEGKIASVDANTFTLEVPVSPEYVGAPVLDNMGRALGTLMGAGTAVVGSPQFCDTLFACTDPNKVWWDITAPSEPRDVQVRGGKGKVTATWKPVASDGGAEVAYWYRIDQGRWTYAQKFNVTVKARKGTMVTVSVQSVNAAGPGPTVTRTARAR